MESGHFNCPQCAQSRSYRHRKVTRFFTLYFIPLIPLGRAGEYVECDTCKGTFIPRVLEQSSGQDEFLANYEKAIRHSMVMVMLADGVIDDNEKEEVLGVINKFGHNDINMPQLEAYVEEVQVENEDVTTYLKRVGQSLNEHGKEAIIKSALSVAAADGHIDDSELTMISRMGQSMEMSSSHLKGIFSEALEGQGN